MSAKDDWLDGIAIQDAIWRMMSPGQFQAYRQLERDGARQHHRRQATYDLFEYIHQGTLIAVGLQTLSDGRDVDRVSYIDKRHYRDFDHIDPEGLSEFSFAGDKFEEIRVIFPPDWTNAEDYVESHRHQASEIEAVAHISENSVAEKKNKGGRPQKRETLRCVLKKMAREDMIDIKKLSHKRIFIAVQKYYSENNIKNPPKEKTIQECVREFRMQIKY